MFATPKSFIKLEERKFFGRNETKMNKTDKESTHRAENVKFSFMICCFHSVVGPPNLPSFDVCWHLMSLYFLLDDRNSMQNALPVAFTYAKPVDIVIVTS